VIAVFRIGLPLAILLCVAFQAGAQEDWLGNEMTIADLDHTAGYLAKAGTGTSSVNTSSVNNTDNIEPAKNLEREDVYVIGGKDSGPESPLAGTEIVPQDVSGNWSLDLKDSIDGATREADLVLYQGGNVVFGRGTISSDGTELPAEVSDRPVRDEGIESMIWWLEQPPATMGTPGKVAASGSVEGNQLILDLVSLEDVTLYKLDLDFGASTLSGSYQSYSSDGATWFGSVVGTIKD